MTAAGVRVESSTTRVAGGDSGRPGPGHERASSRFGLQPRWQRASGRSWHRRGRPRRPLHDQQRTRATAL